METTMKRPDLLTVCKRVACLVVIVMFLVAATPLPATESELAAKPTEAEDSAVEAADKAPQPEATEQPDTAICIDADAGESTGANTLEDIYSPSNGNLASLLKLNAEPTVEETPAQEEVLWTEVEKQTEKKAE